MVDISIIFISCITLVVYLVYHLLTRNFDYWKKRKVPYLNPLPFFGNFKTYILHKTYYPVITREICRRFPEAPYVGSFFGIEPALIVKDPELIKLILTKDFYYFNGREITSYTHKELVTQNLFFTYGDRWKIIRQNLTPLFSSAKMKNMFPLIEKCATTLDTWLAEKTRDSSTVDIRKIVSSYTMDCIGSCIFGVNANTMSHKSETNSFRLIGDKLFKPTISLGLKYVWKTIWPSIFYGLRFQYVEESVGKFFYTLLTDVFASRNYETTQRHDFVDLILSLSKNKFVVGDCITNMKTGETKKKTLEVNDEFLVSNCVIMFAAGYETTSSTLSYTLYELAKNKDAQTAAIQEVDNYFHVQNNISYECVNQLPYLYACVEETLRLYPVLGVITREVMEDYTLPTGVHLEKGLRIHIPVYYLHQNPEYFPDPDKYCPERFYGETKLDIKSYTFLPFGEGPRICLGMRFAKMQIMAGLLTILRKYRVELAEGTPSRLQFEPKSMTAQPKENILLKLIKRTL